MYSHIEHALAEIKGISPLCFMHNHYKLQCIICCFELGLFDINEDIKIEHRDALEEGLISWVEDEGYIWV